MHRSLLVQFHTPGSKQTSFRSTKRGLNRTKKIIAKYHLPPSIACKVCEKIVKNRVINFGKTWVFLTQIISGFLKASQLRYNYLPATMTGPHPETNQHLLMSYSSISFKFSTQFCMNVCSSN